MNRYSTWQYVLLAVLIVLGLIYAAPNLYGEDPAIQVTSINHTTPVDAALLQRVQTVLKKQNLPYLSAVKEKDDLLIRFRNTGTQLKAQDAIQTVLGKQYLAALNLAPKTPRWLQVIGAKPMKLGLDLRGGVHFLLDVDVNALVHTREQGDMRDFGQMLRENNIRYAGMNTVQPQGIIVRFRNKTSMQKALKKLENKFRSYRFSQQTRTGRFSIQATLTEAALQKIRKYAVEQNMTILTNRVNELGVSEAIVQQQGAHQISVDLPGLQDTARAKRLIGKAATLRFQLVDVEHDTGSALAGHVPLGSRLYKFDNQSVLLKNQVILRGDSITYATASFGEDGRPNVTIRLGGGGERMFHRITGKNVGKPLAVVFVETHLDKKIVNGKPVKVRVKTERIINIANIETALGSPFQITGLDSSKYARDLALLLRSGALVAPMEFVQERIVGPSLGQANIHKGILSIEVGALLVIVFMIFYYRLFGLVADFALLLNIVFIVAILSVLGATLTLPGIAGIVLTVGMAVDANVLINERIREELRHGMGVQTAIHAGYARAFTTIVDANVTTLIVAVILFGLGSSSVKGFAVTLTIGLLMSMITAIFFTRGVVNLVYGGRNVQSLSIGTVRQVK